jgi:gliding motility-associated-like protein
VAEHRHLTLILALEQAAAYLMQGSNQIGIQVPTLRIHGTEYGINRPSGIELLPNAAENGCDSLIYIQLTFTQPPSTSAFLGEDQLIFSGDSVCLSIPADLDFSDISWQPVLPCLTTDCSNICISSIQNETVIATISDQNQCLFSDTVNIRVSKERPIFVPNVFAPEADAPNNRFSIFPGIQLTRINWLTVYDRWGSLVFEARDFQAYDEGKAWDGSVAGSKAAGGVYVYAFEVVYPDGTLEQKSGMVTLVR